MQLDNLVSDMLKTISDKVKGVSDPLEKDIVIDSKLTPHGVDLRFFNLRYNKKTKRVLFSNFDYTGRGKTMSSDIEDKSSLEVVVREWFNTTHSV